MTIKKIIGKLHLWLGLSSGIVVFIVAITGCLYAFQEEIQDFTQPYRFVEPQDKAFLPPSTIREIADAALPDKHIHGVLYKGKDRSSIAIYYSYDDKYYDLVYVNPYSGKVLQVEDMYENVFKFILDGHFYLWLPHKIGQPLVSVFTLIFVVMLISGIVLWWPRNKNGTRQRFSIKWSARWRRRNYDLHNVLGFYASALALILALTGLVWGFEWFRDAAYATAGGQKSLTYTEPLSDTTSSATKSISESVDLLWRKLRNAYPNSGSIEAHFPETNQSPIHIAINPDEGTYWKIDYLYFDQYTLEEVSVDHIWDRFEKASVADKLMRMNYDVHTGAIFGLAGKALMFLASLIVASLPITGFYIWWGRKNKKKSKAIKKKKSAKEVMEYDTVV